MDRAVADLQRLCRQPSVSADGEGIAQTAALVASMGEECGGRVHVMDDCGGNPVVSIAFDAGPEGSNRTLLYYNHYDVQPAGPVEAWTSPPFAAEIRGGRLHARGAVDNKGELAARLAAVRMLREQGGLPCRVRFLVEGEEEIGSPTLRKVLDRHRNLFAAEACIWEFGDVDASGRPQIYGGVKGLAFLQVSVRAAPTDLHAGMGAVVESAGWRLVQALATLKDPAGRILIDGFYEGVRPVPEPNALYTDPTCTISALRAGPQGPGPQTVLPRQAVAKLDCRLVPDQDPVDVTYKVRRHLRDRGFADVEVELLSGMPAFQTNPTDPFVGLVTRTAREAWGAEPVFHPSSPGSGPMDLVARALGLPIVSTGCGWFGGGAHGPDESIRLADFAKGIRHQMLLIQRFR